MTLKEKINLLNLKPRNAPPGISVSAFGKWLRAIRDDKGVSLLAETLTHLYCDSLLSSRITGEPCYKSKEDEKNSLVNAVLEAQKRIETVEKSVKAPKPVKKLPSPHINEKEVRQLNKKLSQFVKETPLKISKKKEKTKIIAVKSTSNVWLEEGYTRESGVNTFFKISGELWKVPTTGLKGVVVFGDEERDVDSFKKYQ